MSCIGDVLLFRCIVTSPPDELQLMWRVVTLGLRSSVDITYNTSSALNDRTYLADGISTTLDDLGNDSIVSSLLLAVTTELAGTMTRLECGDEFMLQDAENLTFDGGT